MLITSLVACRYIIQSITDARLHFEHEMLDDDAIFHEEAGFDFDRIRTKRIKTKVNEQELKAFLLYSLTSHQLFFSN
jgi:hypothetical protein